MWEIKVFALADDKLFTSTFSTKVHIHYTVVVVSADTSGTDVGHN